MKHLLIIFSTGLLILMGCTDQINENKLELNSILDNRYHEVVAKVEAKYQINSFKHKLLFNTTMDIYQNSNYIINNLLDYDKPIDNEIFTRLDYLGKATQVFTY